MCERELMTDKAMQAFVTARQTGQQIDLVAFLANHPAADRAALLDFIEDYMFVEAEISTAQADPEALAAVEAASRQVLAELHTRGPSLTELRKARGLLPGKLAPQLKLPADFIGRLERGGVAISSIPTRLVERLGAVLQHTSAEIWAALRAPTQAYAGTRLSADDNTTLENDVPVDFVTALEQSAGLTDEMRAEWLEQHAGQGVE